MRSKTIHVFGGALMSAGMANAQAFSFHEPGFFLNSATRVLANVVEDLGGMTLETDSELSFDATAPDVTADVSYERWTGSALVDAYTLNATASATGAQDLELASWASFTVHVSFATDEDVRFEWAFADANFSFDENQFWVMETDANGFAVGDLLTYDADLHGDSGSLVASLSAGTTYQIFALARVDDPNETSFVNVTVVPAPGSAVLAGIAGLVAVRRRR